MDNPITPIPSTPPQPAVQPTASSLPESPNLHWLLWLASGAVLLTLGIAIGLFTAKFLSQKQSQPPFVLAPTPTPSPTPTPTPDPTANWETYINTGGGYSIKYPQSFLRLICPPGEELTLTDRGTDNRSGPIEMLTCARDARYTLETKTYESIQPEPQETKYYTIEKKNISLGGQPAIQYTHTFTNIEVGPFPIWYTVARVNRNGKTFEIYFDDKDSSQLFDLILSTFKFTSKT